MTYLTLHEPRAVCQTALRWSRTSAGMLGSDSGRPMPLGDLFEFLKRDPDNTNRSCQFVCRGRQPSQHPLLMRPAYRAGVSRNPGRFPRQTKMRSPPGAPRQPHRNNKTLFNGADDSLALSFLTNGPVALAPEGDG
jgi:hypothetical protein